MGFGGGGGECRFYFYGRADFSETVLSETIIGPVSGQEKKGAPMGHPLPRKTKTKAWAVGACFSSGETQSYKHFFIFLVVPPVQMFKPSHNKPSHPHVLSWAIFLSEGFRASVRAIPSQEPATLVLKRRMGVRGTTQGPPLGGQIPPKLTSDRPALI